MDIIKQLSEEFKIQEKYISNTVSMLDEGNTIPFIARYRKELTNSLDDQILREITDRLNYLRGLEKRKEEVCNSIISQEKMTEELQKAIDNAKTLTEVEDLYRPYKQKRRTRASDARDKGLEPLSEILLKQEDNVDIKEVAKEFLTEEVKDVESAIQGAMDIIAENMSDDATLRKNLRLYIFRNALIEIKATDKEQDSVYSMYYEYSEPANKIVGHRILAIDRGERDGFLKVSLKVNVEDCVEMINSRYVKNNNELSNIVKDVSLDSFTRLIFPSLEREIRNTLSDTAKEQAIKVFAVNLEKLLMQPPVKNAITLGFDPGYKHGCKLAVVDGIGNVLDTTIIYPYFNGKDDKPKAILKDLIKKHNVQIIAIGNGTASRESEILVAELLKEIDEKVSYMVVSEAGASVYSASKIAAEEFPDFDVSLRSAVSIARRLQDPLAELVKIDPKAIGVGQYQHDMTKSKLDEALGGVVEDCVNSVGVDLNTASGPLLERVSGVNSGIAKNIVKYREENGAFKNRKELMKVSKLGAKAFTQCAGFLRVSESDNVLDNTGVHPESYKATEKLLKICDYTLDDVKHFNISELEERVNKIGLSNIAKEIEIGEPTLQDIIKELLKPGRDPRDELPKPLLRTDVLDLKDLKPGMELKGTIRNVIDFGAFVDIGVHQDGLVHLSQICDKYIKHPLEVVNVGDIVTVWVMSVDINKKRISLTMKKPQ